MSDIRHKVLCRTHEIVKFLSGISRFTIISGYYGLSLYGFLFFVSFFSRLIFYYSQRERVFLYAQEIVVYDPARSRGGTTARLPSSIYNELRELQRENYKLGLDNTLTLGDIYQVFMNAGYKKSTANKWLLNWAICLCVKFEDPKGNRDYRVRFGDFRNMGYGPNDMLCGGTVWLPCKEVWIKQGEKKICTIL